MEKIKEENKDKIMEMIQKAGDSENYEVSWNEEGVPYKIKSKEQMKKGGKSRAAGAKFELSVRKDLEGKGRIVDKWTNNVDLENKKLTPAKRRYNPFRKVFSIGTGFPDFVSIKWIHDEVYSVVGVEVKMNGILSKEEKEKCKWYLENRIFSKILIAKKGEKRGEIEYEDFSERHTKDKKV